MNKTKKNILVALLLVIALIFALSIIYSELKYRDYSYNSVGTQNSNYKHSLIKDSVNFTLEYSAFNDSDTLLFYTISNKIRLIIWEIAGFSNISTDSINEFSTNELNLITWNPKTHIEFGKESIIIESRSDKHLTASQLNLVISERSRIKHNKRDFNSKLYHLDLNGLAISDKKSDYQLKILFKTDKKESQLLLIEKNPNFYLILMYPIEKDKKLNLDIERIINAT